MVAQLCDYKLQEEVNLVLFHQAFMTSLCLMNIVSSFVTIVGNLLVIPALWKSSSLTLSMKVLFLNLAVSDLAVGLCAQPMFIIITCLMLSTEQNGGHNFDFLCPITMTLFWFLLVVFASSSFFSVTAIALDRFLAVSLHLRYSELITPRRLIITVILLWITSTISAAIFILLPKYNDMVAVSLEASGLFLTTVAYYQIFRIARRHRNQIQSHLQTHGNNQATNMARLKRSTFNTFYVFIVFVFCWLPSLTSFTVKEAWRSHSVEVSAANYLAGFIVFLHSSINPFIFCWRYQEIRRKAIAFLKNIFTKEPQ
ncbi:adenosine receptor A2a-like [Orbicella faveolata]|uniref:adenosine receptor A2a-like n=1 Tax=Orbicella faveolata TaxID=48498 RepID=UPI0009E20EBD|nr:adenosine receptor A2a-like [Orbicella faveolata]